MSTPYGSDPYGRGGPNPYGPYGGQYGGPPIGTQPAKTDGVSIAAFVISLVCCGPLGLILGLVGLSRTKGGQRKGRWAAIAAIVLGLVSTLLGVLIGVLAATGALDSILPKAVNDLETGQCINADGLNDDGDEISNIRVVDCSENHDGEVLGTTELTAQQADDFVFNDQQQIGEYCGTMLPDAVREDLRSANPTYFIYALTETASPDPGDKVVCVVTRADGGDLTEKLG